MITAQVPTATQAEAEVGSVNDKAMTPLRTKQAIDALGVSASVLASSSGTAMVGTTNGRSQADVNAEIISVFDFIPLAEQGAILAGTSTYDCTADIHAARDAVNGTGKTLRFPGGVYYVGEVEFSGSRYAIATAGVTFQQKSGLTGDGLVHPIIAFPGTASDIRMGDINLVGNIDTDMDESSHGIAILSAKNITLGNLYGENLRGDVLYTYGRNTSEAEMQRNLVTGTIRGKNVYRCVVALAGGEVQIAGVIQDGPVGFQVLDVEPNMASGTYQGVTARIGYIRGGSFSVASADPAVFNPSVEIGIADLDGNLLQNSVPGYSHWGGPSSSAIALSISFTQTLRIGSLRLRNYGGYPISLDQQWGSIYIGTLDFDEVETVGSAFKTVIAQQPLEVGQQGGKILSIGSVVGTLPASDRFLVAAFDGDIIPIEFGRVNVWGGKFAASVSGTVAGLTYDCGGGGREVFIDSCRNLVIGSSTITNSAAAYGFYDCQNVVAMGWNANFGAGLDYSNLSTGLVMVGGSVNGMKSTGSQQSEIANAAGGDEVTKINAILTALRAYGLIAT